MHKSLRSHWPNPRKLAVGFFVSLTLLGTILAQLSSNLTDGPLGPLADWVINAGKETVLKAPVAKTMGLGDWDVPMHGLAFKPPGDDRVHIVLVGTSQGQTDIVLTHINMDQIGPMWLTSPTGVVRKTVYEDSDKVTLVTDGRYDADFEAQKAYMRSKVPKR